MGTNTVLGLDPARIASIPEALAAAPTDAPRPPLWDGRAAERIADVVLAEAWRATSRPA
jgi:UDP-N-acetylglucosamine 2-epimerase (non-hydrolysing)